MYIYIYRKVTPGGFRTSGIFPFDQDAVKYDELVKVPKGVELDDGWMSRKEVGKGLDNISKWLVRNLC